MKALVLHMTENYPDLTVYQSSNNRGDQLLSFVYEGPDRSKSTKLELSFGEGCWTTFSVENMLSLWNINQFNYGMGAL